MSRLRVFLIACCLIAVTPHLSGNIVLVSRLSDAEASTGLPGGPPPQTQTGFLPAHLSNFAKDDPGSGQGGVASSTSNSTLPLMVKVCESQAMGQLIPACM